MLIMPIHVTEVEINPPNFNQKRFFSPRVSNLKLAKLKMKQEYTSQKQSNVAYLIVKILVKNTYYQNYISI